MKKKCEKVYRISGTYLFFFGWIKLLSDTKERYIIQQLFLTFEFKIL